MAIKVFRLFLGGYNPNIAAMTERKVYLSQILKPIVTVANANQGFGQVKGIAKKLGVNYSPVPVCVFRRDNRQLLWETKSKADGSYAFRNIAKGLECFVIAFDPNNQYNAVIQDKVVAK